ncbi:MAG: hypothetical protein KHX05_00440, partial [Firmicutes bacterium]|nr:hypothetical protein [Bacillota bacterium]
KNVSPYISRRHRRPAKDSQDKMVLTILSRNSMKDGIYVKAMAAYLNYVRKMVASEPVVH